MKNYCKNFFILSSISTVSCISANEGEKQNYATLFTLKNLYKFFILLDSTWRRRSFFNSFSLLAFNQALYLSTLSWCKSAAVFSHTCFYSAMKQWIFITSTIHIQFSAPQASKIFTHGGFITNIKSYFPPRLNSSRSISDKINVRKFLNRLWH